MNQVDTGVAAPRAVKSAPGRTQFLH